MASPARRDTECTRPDYWRGYPLPGFSDLVSARPDARNALVVTSDANVACCVKMLRSQVSPALVGEIREDEWMLDLLDFVVGSTDSVLRGLYRGMLTLFVIGAVVVDDGALCDDKIDELLANLALFLPDEVWTFPVGVQKFTKLSAARRLCRNSGRGYMSDTLEFSPTLRTALQHFPEVVACPGLGDSCFGMAAYMFADGLDLVQHDWSGLMSFMPGILRGMREETGSCFHAIVLTLHHRAAQVARLVQAFVDYMGLSQQCRVACLDSDSSILSNVNVAVATPERLYRQLETNRSLTGAQQVILVLVEADRLLESQQEQVDNILELLEEEELDVQLGVHSEAMTSLVEEFCRPQTRRIPKAEFSLQGVELFYYATTPEQDTFAALCLICDRLLRSKYEPVVVCDARGQTVAHVKKQLLTCSGRGYMVHDSVDLLRKPLERGVVVTDAAGIEGAPDVITLEMDLSSSQALFEICKMPRDRPRKRVIHLVEHEAMASFKLVQEEVLRLYGADIKPYVLS